MCNGDIHLLIFVYYFVCSPVNYYIQQGRSDGGYIGIYTPENQSTLNFLRSCFVSLIQDKLKLQ